MVRVVSSLFVDCEQTSLRTSLSPTNWTTHCSPPMRVALRLQLSPAQRRPSAPDAPRPMHVERYVRRTEAVTTRTSLELWHGSTLADRLFTGGIGALATAFGVALMCPVLDRAFRLTVELMWSPGRFSRPQRMPHTGSSSDQSHLSKPISTGEAALSEHGGRIERRAAKEIQRRAPDSRSHTSPAVPETASFFCQAGYSSRASSGTIKNPHMMTDTNPKRRHEL